MSYFFNDSTHPNLEVDIKIQKKRNKQLKTGINKTTTILIYVNSKITETLLDWIVINGEKITTIKEYFWLNRL